MKQPSRRRRRYQDFGQQRQARLAKPHKEETLMQAPPPVPYGTLDDLLELDEYLLSAKI